MTQQIIRTRAEAAAERQQQVAQRGDRPGQRRSSEQRGAGFGAHSTLLRSELRASSSASGLLHFTGHASVTEQGYEMWDWAGPYTEVVAASAFDATLKRAGLDVTLNLGHDQMRRIASTVSTEAPLSLEMDDTGLLVDAPQLDPADYDVAYIAPKLRSGLIKEMSFAFRIIRGQWSKDYAEYRIEEVDIHRGDVAIVGYGASPLTDGALRAPAEEVTAKAAATVTDARARALLELALSDY